MSLFESFTLAIASLLVGGLIKHFFDRNVERQKRTAEIRGAAYADFLQAVARLAQEHKKEDLALAADAKVRIAIYGSKAVGEGLSEFILKGGSLASDEGRATFLAVVEAMRKESGYGGLERSDIENLLYGGPPTVSPDSKQPATRHAFRKNPKTKA